MRQLQRYLYFLIALWDDCLPLKSRAEVTVLGSLVQVYCGSEGQDARTAVLTLHSMQRPQTMVETHLQVAGCTFGTFNSALRRKFGSMFLASRVVNARFHQKSVTLLESKISLICRQVVFSLWALGSYGSLLIALSPLLGTLHTLPVTLYSWYCLG